MSYEIKNSPVYGKILYKDGRPVIENYDKAMALAEKFNGSLIKVYNGRYMVKLPESANTIEECGCGGGSEIDSDMSPISGMITVEPENDEIQLARRELYRTAKLSLMLHEILKSGNVNELEGWVQRKLTRAADYIEAVFEYLDYEMRYPNEMMEDETADMQLKQKNLAMQQQRLDQQKQQQAMGTVKVAKTDVTGRPITSTIKVIPDEQVEQYRKQGFRLVGEDASAGASSSGGMASSMSGGNGFLNGGPGTVTRAKRKKKVSEVTKESETGPKFTGYWKGTDKGKPGKKLVGGGP